MFSSTDESASFKEVYNLAIKARDYARQQIIQGTSQIENNDFSYAGQMALETALIDDCKPFYIEKNLLQLDANRLIYDFEATIQTTSQYSLGNCGELAYQALDYVMSVAKANHILAELYTIQGGEHMILVLGRRQDSHISDPMNWGDDAVICDPWAKDEKNQVYPAKEYVMKLKNYTYEFKPHDVLPEDVINAKNERTNLLQDFQMGQHVLMPVRGYHNKYLSENRDIETLYQKYTKKINVLIEMLTAYQAQIDALESHLALNKKQDERYRVLMFKSVNLNDRIRSLKSDRVFARVHKGDYREVRNTLMHALASQYDDVMHAMQLTPREMVEVNEVDRHLAINFGFFSLNKHKLKSSIKRIVESSKSMCDRKFSLISDEPVISALSSGSPSNVLRL